MRIRCVRLSALRAGAFVLAASGFVFDVSAQVPAGADNQAISANKSLAFDVVSIKPSAPDGRYAWRDMPDGILRANFPLDGLVLSAYGISYRGQIEGLPDWAKSDKYDVDAKVDADTAEALKKLPKEEQSAQQQQRMQSLLADRCKLRAHWETKELPTFDLVVAQGGIKMRDAPAGERPRIRPKSNGLNSDQIFDAYAIEGLRGIIQIAAGRLVIDKTGLGDREFDFELSYSPDVIRERMPDQAGPSIFTALEDQLGLKLVPSKAQTQVLVIDHMERPSPN